MNILVSLLLLCHVLMLTWPDNILLVLFNYIAGLLKADLATANILMKNSAVLGLERTTLQSRMHKLTNPFTFSNK